MPSRPHTCWICGNIVDLNNCKTDERGLPVHEACYVARTLFKSKSEPPESPNRGPSS
jgi:hypothetical protein